MFLLLKIVFPRGWRFLHGLHIGADAFEGRARGRVFRGRLYHVFDVEVAGIQQLFEFGARGRAGGLQRRMKLADTFAQPFAQLQDIVENRGYCLDIRHRRRRFFGVFARAFSPFSGCGRCVRLAVALVWRRVGELEPVEQLVSPGQENVMGADVFAQHHHRRGQTHLALVEKTPVMTDEPVDHVARGLGVDLQIFQQSADVRKPEIAGF